MRLLSLDFDPIFNPDATRSSFSSDISVFDYDMVIWDPAQSFFEYSRYSDTYQGLPSLGDSRSTQIKADVQRRKREFIEFLGAGRALIVVSRPPQSCYVATGEVTYSGTGRNARGTRMVTAFDIMQAIPVQGFIFTKARGNRVDVIGDGPLQRLLRQHKNSLEYNAILATFSGDLLARVNGTDRAVATVTKVAGGGHLIMIPPLSYEGTDEETYDPEEEFEWPEEARAFQDGLVAAVEQLSGKVELSRPVWMGDYATEQQRAVREAISKQNVRVDKARDRLSKLQADAEAIELRDQLFLGTGRQLELRVRDVLAQLGGEVSEPEVGRDDWRVAFGDKLAVVEVKGVAKSAAEKQAAQLEKWVAGAFEETGSMPKGVLVVNTWRDVPLADRTQEDFPAQMIPYSTSRQHCLITGLELFVIACEIDEDSSKAQYWREKILLSSGRLEGVPDWRNYLLETNVEVETTPS